MDRGKVYISFNSIFYPRSPSQYRARIQRPGPVPLLGMALSLKNYQNVSNTFHFSPSILGAILEKMRFIGKAKG